MHHHDRLDGVAPIRGQPRLDDGGIDATAPVAGDEIDPEASRSASECQSEAKCPVSNISTRSPADSVLTRAASQAPVPEAG